MIDKYRKGYLKAADPYLAQRYSFGLMMDSISLYLVLGNHDGESVYRLDKGSDEGLTL
jgi:hypothetical protein